MSHENINWMFDGYFIYLLFKGEFGEQTYA